MDLHVDDFGYFISKKSERLLLKRHGKVEAEHPFFDIEQITITSRGVSLSTDVIEECVERGIQINFLTFGGKPYAKLTSPSLSATVVTRREQILAFLDRRGVAFAQEIVASKTRNQINLLKYFGKYRRQAAPEVFDELSVSIDEMEHIRASASKLRGDTIDDIRGQLLSIEGRVAELYWKCIKTILPKDLGFEHREHRGTQDAVNSMLNYGYGILYSRVWGAVLLAGLEPFAGFLHVDRPGKPSLVLDIVEEFRQPIVDRSVISWLNKGGRAEFDDNRLSPATRKEVAQRIAERLNTPETYEGKKQILRHIIQMQARHLATFLRGERKYTGFTTSW